MKRALLSFALVALSATSVLAKPKIAILGLEVTGDVDQAATSVAHDLTEGLRARAKAGGGPYLLAPNSDRELIDEKVIKQCDTEAANCMVDIGKDMDADLLVYGKLEKDGGGFQATLVMLDVKKKQSVKTTFIAVSPGASGEQIRVIAKAAYAELAPSGSSRMAKLIVKANVDTGNVFVDDDLRDTLRDGKVTITLPAGRYRIAVESDGYQREESKVKLGEDDTATQTFELSIRSKTTGGEGTGVNVWKPVAIVSAVIAAGLGGYSALEWTRMRTEAKQIRATRIAGPSTTDVPVDQTDCANQGNIVETTMDKHLASTCSFYKNHKYTAYAAAGVGVVALVTAYIGFVVIKKKETPSRVAFMPELTLGGASAALCFEW